MRRRSDDKVYFLKDLCVDVAFNYNKDVRSAGEGRFYRRVRHPVGHCVDSVPD